MKQDSNIQKKRNNKTHKIIAEKTAFIGPIPPPEMLIAYNKAHPKAADRILKMAEQNAQHRHEIEKRVVISQLRQAHLGQMLSASLSLCSILSGVVISLFSHVIYGIIVMSPGGIIIIISIVERILRVVDERREQDQSKSNKK